MESSLGRLQKLVDKQGKQILDLKERLQREKDEFEIDIRLKKIRHEFMEYECSCCHKKINVPIPKKIKRR